MTKKAIDFIINEMKVDASVYLDRIEEYSSDRIGLFNELGDYLVDYEDVDEDEFLNEKMLKKSWSLVNTHGELSPETIETIHILIRGFRLFKSNGLLDLYVHCESDYWEPLPKIDKSLYDEMQEHEQNTFDKMDDIVLIYRGTSLEESQKNYLDFGQSWTTDINQAKYFAYELAQEKDGLNIRVIMECKISKEYIYAFSHHQQEELCIINPRGILENSVKILEKKELGES